LVLVHPMWVEKKVEADDQFLLRCGREAIVIDEHIDTLAHPRCQCEAF